MAEALGRPTTRVYPAGYVGTVHRPIDEFEAELRDGGFSWDPLSVYHRTAAGNSMDGSWAYRSGPFADRQTHVVLFVTQSDRTDVYAHEEFSWLRHPCKHVAEVDVRRERAVAEMRRWLDDHPGEAGRIPRLRAPREPPPRRAVRAGPERVVDPAVALRGDRRRASTADRPVARETEPAAAGPGRSRRPV